MCAFYFEGQFEPDKMNAAMDTKICADVGKDVLLLYHEYSIAGFRESVTLTGAFSLRCRNYGEHFIARFLCFLDELLSEAAVVAIGSKG